MTRLNLLILFASETGTAQEVAEGLWRKAIVRGLEPRVMAMDDYQMADLVHEGLVVFVVATTGQGDPPANMTKSWTFLCRKKLPPDSLAATTIAVLGLGDSSYTKFNFVAKKLHRRLTEGLGATALCPAGLADDQHDLGPSAVVDPWTEHLWTAIRSNIYPDLPDTPPAGNALIVRWGVAAVEGGRTSSDITAGPSDGPSTFKVSVLANERVTPTDHFQDVRLMSFVCREEAAQFDYEPGDLAYLWPSNSAEAVDRFFSLFEEEQLSRQTTVRLEAVHSSIAVPEQLLNKTFTLENCATHFWDLNVIPSRYAFELLAAVSEDELEKEKLTELSSPLGFEELTGYCFRPRRTVVEVLADFPRSRARLQLAHLFDLMKVIRPRAFSIASSPLEKQLMLLVAVVRYRTKLKSPRLGLCSNWLKSLPAGTSLKLVIKKGSLRFPSPAQLGPVIMVGPGTGVAPFRSFIVTEQLRTTCGPQRPLTLFFGGRNRAADFHFEDDWIRFSDVRVVTAFSRDQPHKIYVQHSIVKEKKEVARQLETERGWLFVAGSSNEMPQSVREAVSDCLVQVLQLTPSEANLRLAQADREGRYQQEVWA